MAITVEDNKKEFPKHPEGVWQAVCCDVVDLGMEKVVYDGVEKVQRKVRIYWQTEEFEPDGKRRFVVAKKFTANLGEKASLRGFIENWAGKKLTKEQLKSFNLEKLIGLNCQLQIVHQLGRDGNVYANVGAILPIKGVAPIHVEGYVRKQDRDKQQAEEEMPF